MNSNGIYSSAKNPRPRTLRALLALAAALSAAPAFATTNYWIAGSAEWTNPANWLSAPFPNSSSDLVIFESAISNPSTITLSAPVTVSGIILDAPAFFQFNPIGNGSLTFASTTGTSTFLITSAISSGTTFDNVSMSITLANTLAITNNSTATLGFTGGLTGTGDLILSGRGEVDLRGSSNTWTPANIFVNAGTLSTLNGTIASLGNINSGTVTIANGAQFDFSGIVSTSSTSQFTKTVVLGGTGVPPVQATLASLNTSASLSSLMGAVILNGGGIFNTRSSAILNIGDPTGIPSVASLSGIGPLIKLGTGVLNINVPASFSGGTSITGGTLVITAPGSLVGTGEIGVYAASRLSLFKPAGSSSANNSVSPNAVNLAGGVLAIQADISLANLFAPDSTTGILSLESGATMKFGGTNLLDFSSLPFGTIIRIGGAGPNGGGGTTTLASTVALIPDPTHTLHFGGIKGTLVLANPINDIAGIPTNVEISTGLQTLILTGTSNYTGTTTIGPSVNVSINSPTALGSSSAPTFINGGTVSSLTGLSLAEPFFINGGILNLNGPSGGPITINSGSLTLTQTGTSVLTIKGGLTTISAPWSTPISQSGGTLILSSSSTAPFTLSGGILNLNATSNMYMPLTGGTVNLNASSFGHFTVLGGAVQQTATGSVANHSVLLQGGRLGVYFDTVTLSNLLDPASTGGLITLDSSGSSYTNASTNAYDFTQIPGGSALSLASTTIATIPVTVLLKPDATTNTLRFGGPGASGTLTINAPINDFSGIPTLVSIGATSNIIFGATANTYTGVTTVAGLLTVNSASSLGAGTGIDANGTIVNSTGKLTTGAGVTLANEKITLNGGSLAIATAGAVVVTVPSFMTGTYSGPISGPGAITSSATTTFSGINTYSGPNFISGGTFTVAATSTLGDAVGATSVQSAILNLNSSTNESLSLNGATLGLTNVQSLTGTYTLSSTNSVLGNATTTTITHALQLSGGATTFSGAFSIAGTSGNGTLNLAAANGISFSAPVTHTGAMSITSGTVTINNAAVPLSASVTIGAAVVNFNNTPSLPLFTLNGWPSGQSSDAFFNSPVAVTQIAAVKGNIAFNGDATIGSLQMNQGVLTFNARATFPGSNLAGGTIVLNGLSFPTAPLVITNGFTVNAPLTVAGTIVVRGAMTINSPNVFPNSLQVGSNNTAINSTLTLTANMAIPSLILSDGAAVTIANGATLTLQDSELGIRRGQIGGSIVGITTIRKTSTGIAGIGDLGPAFNGSIIVEKGLLGISNAGSGTIIVSGRQNAQIIVGTSSQAVFLNNALGDAYPTYGNGAAFFSGNYGGHLDLGTIGSAISPGSSQGGTPVISGTVSGGSLIVVSSGANSLLSFESSTSTYSGLTQLYSPLQIASAGKLTSTSGVVLYNGGNLILIGNGATDQIANNIPIFGDGGSFTLSSGNQSPAVPHDETASTFAAQIGNSTLALKPGYGAGSVANSTHLTLASLSRVPGATVTFLRNFGTGNTPDPNSQFLITTSPTLQNGILGAWATFSQVPGVVQTNEPPDFATYGINGVAAFTAYVTNINSAGSTDNVNLLAPGTLNSSKTINSLRVIATTLDLGGKTLTLDSGGAILFPAFLQDSTVGIIQNGTLLAGASVNGELIITGKGTISAAIPDRPDGPTSLTISGASITLVGPSTYTGPTHVASGQLTFNSLASVASGTSLFLDGGNAYFNFTSSAPITLASITTGPNYVQLGSVGSPLSVIAGSYNFNQADLFLPLLGSGPMAISGRVTLDASASILTNYQGNIAINDGGILTQNGISSFTSNLGSGTVTINAGGQLLLKYAAIGNVVLNGGLLTSGTGFGGSLHVTANSTVAEISVNALTVVDAGIKLNLENAQTQSISGGGAVTVPKYAFSTTDGITLASLNVSGKLVIRSNGSVTGTSKVSALNLSLDAGALNGILDLTNNKFIVSSTDANDKLSKITTFNSEIISGYAAGTWSGTGITSSTAATDPTIHSLGIADNALLGYTSFGGATVDPNSILLAYALLGDANFDGHVNAADLSIIQANFNHPANNWAAGDLNYDGIVNTLDVNLVVNHWDPGSPYMPLVTYSPTFSFSLTTIPEPAAVAIFAAGGISLLFRRRTRYYRSR